MYRAPSSTHGFLPVIVAFHCYVLLVLVITAGLRMLGVPDGPLLVAVLVVGAVLLKAFLPVFRRLAPGPVEIE